MIFVSQAKSSLYHGSHTASNVYAPIRMKARHACPGYIARRKRPTRPLPDADRQRNSGSASTHIRGAPLCFSQWKSNYAGPDQQVEGGEKIGAKRIFEEVPEAFFADLVSPEERALERARTVGWTRNCPLHLVCAKTSDISTIFSGSQFCVQRSFGTTNTPSASSIASM